MEKAVIAMFFLLVCSASMQGLAAADDKAAAPPTAAKSPSPPLSPKAPAAPAHKGPWYPWHHVEIDPKVKKCVTDFITAKATCYREAVVSYWTKKIAIGADCCKAISEADNDCGSTVFGHFNNPFFVLLLKEHCARIASSAPAPPKKN